MKAIQPRVEAPVTIRRMLASDIAAGLRLCRLSHWNQVEEDWRVFLASRSGGGRIAERGGRTAGTVAFLKYGQCFSWLSMMLVDPEMRGAGIGTRLMEAALDALTKQRCVRLDATPLGEPLYRRFGFTGECELLRVKATLVPGQFRLGPEDVRPIGPADLAEIYARDREVFGADRSRLLSSFRRRAPGLAWTVRRGGALAGYCFGRSGYLYRQLGPVVAESAEVARALVTACLAGLPGETVAMDVTRHAGDWVAWLSSVGFATERPFLRMRRGEMPSPVLARQEFAIAGPEFG